MAARTPKKPQASEEQSAEQSIETSDPVQTPEDPPIEPVESDPSESDPASGRRLPRKPLVVSLVVAVTALLLGVGGWLVYSNVQAAIELGEARDAYETSVAELVAAQAEAKTAEDELSALFATLTSDVETAEQLVELLGEDSETVLAAAETTREARTLLDEFEALTSPAKTAGKLSENPTVEEYDALRAKLDELLATVKTYTKAVNEQIAEVRAFRAELTAIWRAQTDAVPDIVEATLAANENASQEAKDAVTAAGDELVIVTNPLDAEVVELWRALHLTSLTLASEEQAYQDQKAAEEEAARQRARGNSGGGNPGSGGGNQSGENPGSSGDYSYKGLEALVASRLGIPADQVHCYSIPRGNRCDYPGGYSIVTI